MQAARSLHEEDGSYPRWIWGVFYYHPGDSRLLIPIRGGRDHIFNYAKPIAGLLTAGSIVLPLLGGALMIGGFLRYFDLVASHLGEIALPTLVVLACLATILSDIFIRDDVPVAAGAVEPPWAARIRNRHASHSA